MNAPAFFNPSSGNLRLQSNSPCINAGNNASATGATDMDGRPRITGGTVDMGAYELQPNTSGAFIGWLAQHSLPTDGSADNGDTDNDLANNQQDWIAGTIPTDPFSVLRLLGPKLDPSGLLLTWQSVSNRSYFVERADDLATSRPFSTISSNIPGQPGTSTYTDTNASAVIPGFYPRWSQSLSST